MSARALLLLGLAAAGCTTGRPSSHYTPAQLAAIETREVNAGFDATFRAAAEALFDAGYTVALSDRKGGLLTGSRRTQPGEGTVAWSPVFRGDLVHVSVLVRQVAPERCTVRLKLSVKGQARVHERMIDRLWVLMQRQVLMKEPPRVPS
ncbi:MAG: hotdog family protein [Planctomycetota bacterium]